MLIDNALDIGMIKKLATLALASLLFSTAQGMETITNFFKDIIIGSQNLGNTCYQNACIAAFCYNPYLALCLLEHEKELADYPLLKQLAILAKEIHFKNRQEPLRPEEFRNLITTAMKSVFYKQEDAGEAFQKIMEIFYAASEEKGLKHLRENLMVEYKETTTCDSCNSKKHDLVTPMTSIDLPHAPSLAQAIKKFNAANTETRNLDCEGDCLSKAQHEIGRKTIDLSVRSPHTVTRKINKVPPAVAILINRNSEQLSKITDPITIPLKNVTLPGSNELYKLCSVIVHAGETAKSGHYYTITQFNNKWYEVNDSEVSELSEASIKEWFENQGYYKDRANSLRAAFYNKQEMDDEFTVKQITQQPNVLVAAQNFMLNQLLNQKTKK